MGQYHKPSVQMPISRTNSQRSIPDGESETDLIKNYIYNTYITVNKNVLSESLNK